MKQNILAAAGLAVLLSSHLSAAGISRTEANNGNLVMEEIPEIPQSIVSDLNRYQNVRQRACGEHAKAFRRCSKPMISQS